MIGPTGSTLRSPEASLIQTLTSGGAELPRGAKPARLEIRGTGEAHHVASGLQGPAEGSNEGQGFADGFDRSIDPRGSQGAGCRRARARQPRWSVGSRNPTHAAGDGQATPRIDRALRARQPSRSCET